MRSHGLRIAIGVLASAMWFACSTQAPPPSQPPAHLEAPEVCAPITSDAPAALQHQPGYHQFAVAVKDASGREVRGLSKDDFILERDNKTVAVQFVQYTDGPASVLILVDASGSSLTKLPQIQAAISQLVNDLDPRDDVSLLAFSTGPYQMQPFTRDHVLVVSEAAHLHPYGPTSLYDSMPAAGVFLENGCYATRILVVITDGQDNTSHKTIAEAAHDVKATGVSAYAIAIGNSDVSKTKMFFVFVVTDPDSYDEKGLAQLTEPSGGSIFTVAMAGDHDRLQRAATTILKGSRGQYVIGFIHTPRSSTAPAQLRIRNHDDYSLSFQNFGAPSSR